MSKIDKVKIVQTQWQQKLSSAMQSGQSSQFSLLLAMYQPQMNPIPLQEPEFDLRDKFDLPKARPLSCRFDMADLNQLALFSIAGIKLQRLSDELHRSPISYDSSPPQRYLEAFYNANQFTIAPFEEYENLAQFCEQVNKAQNLSMRLANS